MFENLLATLVPALLDRGVLVLNHVLKSQPMATEKLMSHVGRTIDLDWIAPAGAWPVPPAVRLRITPAGLVERAIDTPATEAAALRMRIELPAPQRLVGMTLAGERPRVDVEGDAQFAADVAWLAEHLRWDVEHDLARLLGDAPARYLTEAAASAMQAVRGVAQSVSDRWERHTGPGPTAAR